MKFFKHFINSDQGTLNELMNEHGVEAYGRYWLLVQMCCRALKRDINEELNESHFVFTFNRRQLCSQLRTKSVGLDIILTSLSDHSCIQADFDGDKVIIKFPKLLECIDRDSKRARTVRGTCAPKKEIKIKKEIYIQSDAQKEALDFESVYKKYPRKQGKTEGFKRMRAQIKTTDTLIELHRAVDAYNADILKNGTGAQFIKQFSTFMNSWRDWIDPDGAVVDTSALRANARYESTKRSLEPVVTREVSEKAMGDTLKQFGVNSLLDVLKRTV